MVLIEDPRTNEAREDVGFWSSCYLVVESALRGAETQEAERKSSTWKAQLAELRRNTKTAQISDRGGQA